MRFIIATLMAASLATTFAAAGLAAQDATGAKKSSASKAKSASKSATAKRTKSTKSVASKPAAVQPASAIAKPVAHRKTSKSTKKPAVVSRVVSRRYAQQTPTTQRYKEIQQALAERGYFRGDPDGTWGPESIDSLKRFQRDQSLAEDGKIGSLSLIALGLGPKRTAPEPAAIQNP